MREAQVKDIIAIMEEWAPAWSAEPWDRVGLITGEPNGPAKRIIIALELSESLLTSALNHNQQMLLLHHSPLFAPLVNLRSDQASSKRLLKATAQGLALFIAHTNLDAAPGGVNDALAMRLGLIKLKPLASIANGKLAKLVTFVPIDYADEVTQALFKIGAGRIGSYRECAFFSLGEGHFFASKHSQPFLGQPEEKKRIKEIRLETIFPLKLIHRALAVLTQIHPYEEPAIDIYPLQNLPSGFGLGRIGCLPVPELGRSFLARAANILKSVAPSVAGPIPKTVKRIAVLGGALTREILSKAALAEAQILITGEASYHTAQEAIDLGLCLVTLGHFETENVVIKPWAQRLTFALSKASLDVQVIPWNEPERPWHPVIDGKEDLNIVRTNSMSR